MRPAKNKTTIRIIRRTPSDNEIATKWYALKTKSRAEKKVHEVLIELGLESYLPISRELRQWSDRRKWVEVPMFRSYVFVKTNNRHFQKVLEIDGAVHFVKFNNEHAVIQEEQIDLIKKIVDNKIRFEVTADSFEPGDKVIVTDGPFKGQKGEWIQKKTKYNICITIHQLNMSINLEIPAAYVEKIPEEATG